MAKAKAAIEFRAADQYAALRAAIAKCLQSRLDQTLADASPLEFRSYSNRPKNVPPAIHPVNPGRRERDMAHGLPFDLCYQGNAQSIGGTQRLDDQVLSLPAVGMIGKGCNVDAADCGEILHSLGTDLHRMSPL
jgi:hypothetical protein